MPDLVIIEGLWGTGKSTLLKGFSFTKKICIDHEPNHIDSQIKKDISQWYIKTHLKRLKNNLKNNGHTIIMERSMLSSMAFKYATNKKLNINNQEVYNLLKTNKMIIIFLYAENSFVRKNSSSILDKTVKKWIQQESFINKYNDFFKKVLPANIGKDKIITIKIDKNGKYLSKKNITKKVTDKINYYKEKTKETSVAGLIYFKNKILTLYDLKFKHYVLPQGHIKVGEKLKQTIAREIKEETGFTDFYVGKKIKTYQYHFTQKNKIVYKKIHVYFVKLLSKRREKKSFEKHEMYQNKFFSPNDTEKILKWDQDKDVVKRILPYL